MSTPEEDLDLWLERAKGTDQLDEAHDPTHGAFAAPAPAAAVVAAPAPAPVEVGKPNLNPFGMEAPPEVSRDRIGEVAAMILGTLAGKDKYARRAALAGGAANMISAKPTEEVAKENYDRRLKAASLAYAEKNRKAQKDPNSINAYQQAQIDKWKNENERGTRSLDMRTAETERKFGENSDSAHRFADVMVKNGVPQDQVYNEDGSVRSYQELLDLRGTYGKQIDLAQADAKNEAAAQRAGMTEQARTDVEVKNAPRTTAVAADKARAVAEATAPVAEVRSAASARGTESVTGANEQSRLKDFRNETEKTRPQVVLAADLDKVLAKHAGKDGMPGVGMWDSWKSGKLGTEDDLAVRGAVTNITDLVARVRSGAAIPPREFDKIAAFVSAGEGATEKQFLVAYKAYRNGLRQEIQQQAAGREAEARSILGPYADWAFKGKTAPAPKGTPKAAPAAPAASGPKPSPAGLVHMRNPATGTTGYVKPERVQQKIADGYEVID